MLRREVVAPEEGFGDADVERQIAEVVVIRRVDAIVADVYRTFKHDRHERGQGEEHEDFPRAGPKLTDRVDQVRSDSRAALGFAQERQWRRGQRCRAQKRGPRQAQTEREHEAA